VIQKFNPSKGWTTVEEQEPMLSQVFQMGDKGEVESSIENPRDMIVINQVLIRFKPKENDVCGLVYIL